MTINFDMKEKNNQCESHNMEIEFGEKLNLH